MCDTTITITGPEQIEGARWLAVRSALRLEISGFRRSRGRSARRLANEITGQNHRAGVAAYDALNARIVQVMGARFDRPLTIRGACCGSGVFCGCGSGCQCRCSDCRCRGRRAGEE
jgi:hypothetical protein